MSLAVYVGINKFKAESNADVREQSAIEITLSDIAKGQPHTDKISNAENPFLVVDTFNEEALASLKNWLKKDTKNECVIAWPQPDAWLAVSLASEAVEENILNEWMAQAKRLLALFRSARRQVTLVGYSPGCELEVVQMPMIAHSVNAVYQLAAAYLCSQSQALKDTYAYLAASSQECPVELGHNTEVAQAALSEYHARQAESEQGRRDARALQEAGTAQERQQQDIARMKGELSSASDERALLLEQLQSVQQAVAERADERALLLEQLQSAQQLVAERTDELQAQREQFRQITQRLQELKPQLQTLNKENASFEQACETQRKEKEVAEQHNQSLKKENEALKQAFESQGKEQDVIQQHMQALQKESEALKQAFDAQNKEKEINQQRLEIAQKENAQLLGTLQHVQQAYEILSVEHQTQSQQLSKHQRGLDALRSESEQRIHSLERLVQWLRVHAQRHAAVAYRDSRSYKKALPKQIAALEASPLFDADWYCKQYPDVAQSTIQPAEHFIKFGAIDGRHPGPLFSTEFYLTHYEDVAASGQHPLLHYLRHGKEEEREIRPPQYRLSAPQTMVKGTAV